MIKQTGLTLERLADDLGDTSSTSLSAYQRGERLPPRDLLLKLIAKTGQTRQHAAMLDLLTRAGREREQVHNNDITDQLDVQPVTSIPTDEQPPNAHKYLGLRRWSAILTAGAVLVVGLVLAGLFLFNLGGSGQQPSSATTGTATDSTAVPGPGPSVSPVPLCGDCQCYTIVNKDVHLRDYYSNRVGKELAQGQQIRLVREHPTNPELVLISSEIGTGYILRKYLGEPGCPGR